MNVSVVDDDVVEMAEFFTITLERTSDLDSRIMLNQRYGVIEIIDNDGLLSIILLYTINRVPVHPLTRSSISY